MKKIELLAPAANLNSGKAAIDAGADALYVGGPAFGAREKAGNPIEDIAALAKYAHQFGAKVYMVMNTIIYDSELEAAERLVWQAWDAGVDALIVQDMALLEMNLPPIPLHASTQTFNLTSERVAFLARVGFDKVILERGITLKEIANIREATDVELEAFVHGAICVGYSGQCYLSEALCGRSGNRGACAQPCRSLWTLVDENGKVIRRNRTLLSLGDLNLSENLEELIAAGVCSLKIEGRLKDEGYVANNVAYYNRKLHEIGAERTSVGVSTPDFEPNPEKSFSRSFSNYFLIDRKPTKSLLNNSQGEYIGRVTRIGSDYFELNKPIKINNGDGISFTGGGTNINTTQGDRIFPNRMDGIAVGLDIYRNSDRSFNPKAVRKIDVQIEFKEGCITAKDSTGIEVQVEYGNQEQATNAERAAENIRNAFSKSGDTIFRVTHVEISATPFMPMSRLNELRRELLDKLLEKRLASYHRTERKTQTNHPPYPLTENSGNNTPEGLDYRGNVANRLARQFYEKCGVVNIDPAFELSKPQSAVLLRTRHCIRREFGICLKENGSPREALFIENNGRKLSLNFDCTECEMLVVSE